MKHKVELTRDASKYLRRLDKPTQVRVRQRLHELGEDPLAFSKTLVGTHVRSSRVGDFRILFEIQGGLPPVAAEAAVPVAVMAILAGEAGYPPPAGSGRTSTGGAKKYMHSQNAMRLCLACMLLLVLSLGCSGLVKARYEVISADALPEQISDWRELPTDRVDVRDAVLGDHTYIRIVVGPCPVQKLQVKAVLEGGPGLTVVTTMGESDAVPGYPVLYLPTAWKTRTKFGPEYLTLTINDWPQTFYAFPRGGHGHERMAFRPAVIYEPGQDFQCVKPGN